MTGDFSGIDMALIVAAFVLFLAALGSLGDDIDREDAARRNGRAR